MINNILDLKILITVFQNHKRKLRTTIILVLITSSCYAQTTIIDSQVWCTKNLNVLTFRNGEAIPQAKSAEEWRKASINKQPAWCYYENDSNYDAQYGKLYNWYAVNDPRGLSPIGYHIPSSTELFNLKQFLAKKEGEIYSSQRASYRLKSIQGWNDDQCNGDNSSGFSGLPGGYRGIGGNFGLIGKYAYWWSSTENNDKIDGFYIYCDGGVNGGVSQPPRYNKGLGFSVRCIKDSLEDK